MNKRQTNTKVDTIMTTITIQYDCFQVQMLSKKEINRLMFNTEFKWMSTLQLKTWKKVSFYGEKTKNKSGCCGYLQQAAGRPR